MMRTRWRVVVIAALGLSLSALPGPRAHEELSASADVGRVLDREGGAARRAVLATRWSPVERGTAIEVGDWLEVPSRGANALKVRLAGGAELILGPGTLLEVESGEQIALARGEVEVELPQGVDTPVRVMGPGETTVRVERRAVLRADERQLVRRDEDPRWLVGYESNASTEAMGSLLAHVDGRNLPLTIGYHKVTVDVRDQIARTVIEESFLNHTHSVLEGVFYFPLPADASISGFGMWIGDELVQGDIVEKQRAREIYETILRERRDPGLLEWTGGNLFKARIFPIGDEKRIRIAYTQVLPKDGNTVAYHYALQSELLRRTPLQRLEIEVNVSSQQPLAAVDCPSHATRIRTTEHAARIEFAAEEFAPERDFELRIELQPDHEPLTVIPHRRGDDGYFMLLIDPPPGLASGKNSGQGPGATEPLELLLLADTSGSMQGAPRKNQVAFLEGLIAALGERDTFNLATCDVDTRWVFDRPLPNTLENRERALRFLEQRDPLGWSDLHRAFAAARERARVNTDVVYVGDGVPTAGAADPIELAHELQGASFKRGTFHAVVPGPQSERAVLRALASIGGGSVRSIGGGTDPTQTAFALLREISTPAFKNLEVHFEGLAVAAVYPEVLPHLTAGAQQIVVGRFDPRGGDRAGRVRLTGTLGGDAIEFEREVTLVSGDEGNSFIPRLWAREHLDHLLDQGASDRGKERIIALSEDFQIVTPYTSFLVLESDADRERFGVEKRFRMRDGEEFFAEGKDSARHQLVREQMLAAKGWRNDLRASLLRSLEGLGRDLTELLRGAAPLQLGALGLGALDRRDGDDRVVWEYEGDGDKAPAPDEANEGDAGPDEFPDSKEELHAGEPSVRQEMVASERVAKKSVAADLAVSVRGNGLSSNTITPASSPVVGGRMFYQAYHGDPFGALFPALGGPREDDPEGTFPAEVLEVLRRIDRRRALADSMRAWRFEVETSWTDARGRTTESTGSWLVGPDRWVTSSPHVPGQVYALDWLQDGQRGTLGEGWRLGRTRTAAAGDAHAWAAPFAWYFGDIVRPYAAYKARRVDRDDGRIEIVFWLPATPEHTLTLEIDAERGLVLEQFSSVRGERTHGQRFEDFHEVGGLWWPRTIRPWNKDARGESRTRIEVDTPDAVEQARLAQAALARRDDALLLDDQLPSLAAAKQAVQDGGAGFAEHWVLLTHFSVTQRWDRAAPHFEALSGIAAGKPGLVPLRLVWLQQRRRQEELRQELLQCAADLTTTPRDADHGLALQILSHSQGLNQGNEVLQLLEAIRPVFLRQPRILDAELPWDQRRLQALANMNRPEELFQERRTAAERWPHDLGMQTEYAALQAQRGEVDAALQGLATAEKDHGPWQPYERQRFRNTTLQILWGGYRLEPLVETFEAWEQDEPELLDAGVASQYLSALIFLDREDEAWRRIEAWTEPAGKDPLPPAEAAFLQAAIQHALGQGYHLYHQRLEEDHAGLLASVARRLAQGNDTYQAGQILPHWIFRSSDPGLALQKELFVALQAGVEEFDAPRLQRWIQWLRAAGYAADNDAADWQPVLERVFSRWLRAVDPAEHLALGQVLVAHASTDLRIRYRREVLARAGGEDERIDAATQLFHELLGQPWSPAVERELVALMTPLASTADDADRRASSIDRRVLALYELVRWIERARTEAIVTALPGFETLSRRSLRTERQQALRAARESAIALVAKLEETFTVPELRNFAALEGLSLKVLQRVELDAAWQRALDLLKHAVDALVSAEEADDVPLRERIVAQRCILTCTFLLLSTDEAATPGRTAALRAELDRLIAREAGADGIPDGRAATRDLLILLDQGDALGEVLASWFEGGAEFVKVRWGTDLAYVLAERGRLEEATRIMEEIDAIDELGERDLAVLAGWYTAQDRRDLAREAKVRSFEAMGDDALANDLYQRSSAYQRRGEDVPPELDPDIPLRFVALLRKARQPQNHFWVLSRFYEATKDFRLLECLPDAVIGQSAQNIYPFLSQVGSLAASLDEEATADRIQAQLAGLRERATTDVDRRALSLLQFQILLQAARQAHGTERHAERSLQALREAFPGAWAEGEIGLLAGFLAAQGRLQPEALAAEQRRQLRALHALATDPDERYAVGQGLAVTLWAYADHDAAVQTLEAALNERRGAASGRLPQSANDGLQTLSSWLVSLQSYRAAEKLWDAELAASHPRSQVLWLRERRFEVYRDAVLQGGDLSLGKGEDLYVAVVRAIRHELKERTQEQHASQVVHLLSDLWQRGHRERRLARIGEDLTDFAFGELPAVLDLYQYRSGQQMVGAVAECLQGVRGAVPTLEFLIVRAENEPGWLRLQNQSFWQQHAWRLGNALQQAGRLDDSLDRRILRVVQDELRADLGTRQQTNRSIYDRRYGNFWSAKHGDFLRTALRFVEERGDSPRSIAYAAEYLYQGLQAHDAAIEALDGPYRRGTLHRDGRDLLATYLQERLRWAESIPVVTELIQERPAEARYRVMAMLGHFHTGDGAARRRVLDEAESWFRGEALWTEAVIAELGNGCLRTELHADCARLLGEAIALHVRSAPDRGVGDGVLSTYYRDQSGAYAGLGRTDQAVDAAAGAIVSWGRDIGQRNQELHQLVGVLERAPDLPAYLLRLDAEVAATGLENPILRKALGQLYLRRQEYAAAARQLALAVRARPEDGEVHALLVQAHDGQRKPELAADALLEWARASGHELNRYVDLGRRLLALGQAERSERAFTSLIELSAHESEGHQLLAEVREQQQRWDAAALHWAHVTRIRANEPDAYVRQARCLIRLARLDEARALVDHLRTTAWPSRFGDLRPVAEELRREMDAL